MAKKKPTVAAKVPVRVDNRLPQPKESGKPLNPMKPENWKGVEPRNEEEMNEWLEAEKKLLWAYLVYYKRLVEHESTHRRIADAQSKVDKEWQKWEPECDAVFGEIYDNATRKRAEHAMAGARKDFNKVFSKKLEYLTHNDIHERYTLAQTLWEDFHFYQNTWNRARSDDPKDLQRAHRSWLDMDDDEFSRERAMPWRLNMIDLYNKWDIGDRSKLTKRVGPGQLHIYPDNLRHTGKDTGRRKALMEHFTISDVRLDEEAIAEQRGEVERKRKGKETAQDQTNSAVTDRLPDEHQPYYAATEHSKPWTYQNRRIHTSWETADWGHAVANKTRVVDKRVSKQPLYKTNTREITISGEGTLFGPAPGLERTYDRKSRYGGWVKGGPNIITETFFVLDDDGQRIPEENIAYGNPRFLPAGTVTAVNEKNGEYLARREEYLAKSGSGVDELSDVEDEADYEDDEVPLPDEIGEQELTGTNPPDDSDDDSDDENDPFTRSYRGLDVFMTDRPPHDVLPPPPASGGETPSGDATLPAGNGSDSESSSDSSDSDVNDNDPDSGSAPVRTRRRVSRKQGEHDALSTDTIEDGWVTQTHTVPGGRTFVQRDRIPAPNPEAGNKPRPMAYPVDAAIPDPRKGTKDVDKSWVFDEKNGIYRKGIHKWRPVFILRKYQSDTGQCIGRSDKSHLLDKVIQSNFSKESVRIYNKGVTQYLRRYQAIENEKTVKHPPWSQEEIAEAVRYLNDTVRKDGLTYLVENWEALVKSAIDVLELFRTANNISARGRESTRTKLSADRAPGVHEKLNRIRDRTAPIPEAELRPRSFFTARDFESDSKKLRNAAKAKKAKVGENEDAATKTTVDATTEISGNATIIRKRKTTTTKTGSDTNSKKTMTEIETADGDGEGMGGGEEGSPMEIDGEEEESEVGFETPPPKRRRKN